eukprot:snap_masked-scaffold_5-processed-gene-14.22-mRNA-1 protein AED:0.37 eAED:0.37 QI:0/-1/0/1/-1/1/1/0/1300
MGGEEKTTKVPDELTRLKRKTQENNADEPAKKVRKIEWKAYKPFDAAARRAVFFGLHKLLTLALNRGFKKFLAKRTKEQGPAGELKKDVKLLQRKFLKESGFIDVLPNTQIDTDEVEALKKIVSFYERQLYISSKSKEEYLNKTTLIPRLLSLKPKTKLLKTLTPLLRFQTKATERKQEQKVIPGKAASTVKKIQLNEKKLPLKVIKQEKKEADERNVDEIVSERRFLLLTLYHSLSCTPETCKVGADCLSMKKLWNHVKVCKNTSGNKKCPVENCALLRTLVFHYKSCLKPACKLCYPIRCFTQFQNRGQGVISPEEARGCVSGTGPNYFWSLSNRQFIKSHLRSLATDKLMVKLLPILRRLIEHKHNKGVFNEPVDVVKFNIPHYAKVISEPMDLGTIRNKLEERRYSSISEFDYDVRLVFKNAMKFNPPMHPVHHYADSCLKFYENDVTRLSNRTRSGGSGKCGLCFGICEKCPLCEEGCVAFVPKVVYCSGKCGQRVARNVYFYTTPTFKYCFCIDCYNRKKKSAYKPSEQDDDKVYIAGGGSIKKSKLQKRKNNELLPEPWVQCDTCNLWMHQVCALYNDRKDTKCTKFTCPKCILKLPKQSSNALPQSLITDGTAKSAEKINSEEQIKVVLQTMVTKIEERAVPPAAEDLPRSKLGDFLQNFIRKTYTQLVQRSKDRQQEYEKSEYPPAESLVVRVVHNGEETCKLKPTAAQVFKAKLRNTNSGGHSGDGIKSGLRSATKKFMETDEVNQKVKNIEFSFRSRCISVFQKIDSVDTLLFVMFVQEYPSQCLQPNRNKLYVAYLDSVHFFRPRQFRTRIYHDLLVGYLEWSRRRGFEAAYIWACPPPNKRDDYILHCHPEEQRVPNPERLRAWYQGMVRRGIKLGVVASSSTLLEQHQGESLTSWPYFEGDYWPQELEEIGKNNKSTISTNLEIENLEKRMKMQMNHMKQDFLVVKLLYECVSCKIYIKDVRIELDEKQYCRNCAENLLGISVSCYKPMKREPSMLPLAPSRDTLVPMSCEEKSKKFKLYFENVPAVTPTCDEPLPLGSRGKFMESRHSFLALCVSNRYQFNQLRKAKHSSLMLLYHLHNPAAPAHLYTCNSCGNDIIGLFRFSCSVCHEFSQCAACFNRLGHSHAMNKLIISKGLVETIESQQVGPIQRRGVVGFGNLLVEGIKHFVVCQFLPPIVAEESVCKDRLCQKMLSAMIHSCEASIGCKMCILQKEALRKHKQYCVAPKGKPCFWPWCKNKTTEDALSQSSMSLPEKGQLDQGSYNEQQTQLQIRHKSRKKGPQKTLVH